MSDIQKLRTLRTIVAEEINRVKPWTQLTDEYSRGSSAEMLQHLEEILADIDEILIEEAQK